MEEKNIGKIEFKFSNQETLVHIQQLFPYLENGDEISLDYLKTLIESLNIDVEINYNILQYYISKAIINGKVLNNVCIACGKNPIKKKSAYITFLNKNFSIDTIDKWSFINDFLTKLHVEDLTQVPAIPLYYVKKGDVIAKLKIADEAVNGLSVTGDVVPSGRFQSNEYTSGEGVHYDESKKHFIAGYSGYVQYKDNTISIHSPFLVSRDKMNLYFINFTREPFIQLEKSDIATYILKEKIDRKTLLKDFNLDVKPGIPVLLARGKEPEKGKDAFIEILVELCSKCIDNDEEEKIDYREVKQFPSVNADELLAKKVLPVPGEDGYDIFGNIIKARTPKDLLLKNGLNTYKKDNDHELLIYSREDGLIEYKNNILSVFPQLHIPGDIDFSTGNINTKVNVHINGNVRTGFKVISEKNIFIKGIIEDNCHIEAGGDLIINGGATGEKIHLSCQGNMSIKFMESCNVFVKGKLSVQRFILAANVECLDTITVMGSGINLNEKGAIIDCDIKVKNALFCPSIGNDTGIKTTINFGYDKLLNQKISNLEDTISKINNTIEELKSNFEDDITSPNIFNFIKGYAKSVKDDIIKAIQEKNKLDNQLKMMQKILDKELSVKKDILMNASIQISNKVFPTLALECDTAKKVIDTLQPPSKYYLEWETKWIERSSYLTNK